MIKKIILIICTVFLTAAVLSAQDLNTDESSMFSGETLVDTNKIINNSILSNANQKSVTLSGNIQTYGTYSMARKWLKGDTNTDANQLTTYIQGNLFLDIRLTQGIKAFGNIQAFYSPQGTPAAHNFTTYNLPGATNILMFETNNTILSLKEFFMDANINKAAYFRVGKQVLQWGRGYFWTPSDLINVEQKNFYNLSAYREGSYGIKTHIPFGTVVNLYSYLNMTGITKIEDTAFSGKAEFLINAFEFAASIWAKRTFHPVYAVDFATRLFSFVDVWGEASFADYNNKIKYISNQAITFPITTNIPAIGNTTNQLVTKISLGFSKSFDFMDISDRINVIAEFYYNSDGYNKNLFKNDIDRQYFNGSFGGFSLYEANNHYTYYWALFTTIAQFITPDITLSLNAIGNFVDYSFAFAPTISWNPVYDFTISFNLYTYIGDENTEYTFTGNALAAGISASLLF